MKTLISLTRLLPLLILAACSKPDPQTALDAAAIELEHAIIQRQPKAIMRMLHDDFSGSHGIDRHLAHQQMLALFLRYQTIKLLVVNRTCALDKGFYDRGHCSAHVGITGAQGLIPERAELYQVNSSWQLQDKNWLLLSMEWE